MKEVHAWLCREPVTATPNTLNCMDPELNPFRPGSGLNPPVLVGRDDERSSFDLVVAKSKKRVYGRGLLLSGYRGIGKITLLNDLAENAERHGWLNIKLEARSSASGTAAFQHQLSAELETGLRNYAKRHSLRNRAMSGFFSIAKSLSVSVGPMGVTVSRGTSGQVEAPVKDPNLEIALSSAVMQLAAEAKKRGAAVGLFIDEMQALDPDVASALLAVQHRAGQENWAFCLSGAGLPSLPMVLADAQSYAERQFDYRDVGPLSKETTATAISTPIRDLGCSITDGALEVLYSASEGYPYFVQEYGAAIWNTADSKVLDYETALEAVERGTKALDAGFFRSRWGRASADEKAYLRALANSPAASPSMSQVAQRAGRSEAATAGVFHSVMEKGFVWEPEPGKVAFSVPWMSDFIRRQSR